MRGPDVVRAVALIGVVVMNYQGYLILRRSAPRPATTGWLDELFDPWDGPLSTRFAATFVLVAGVGITLLTRRSRADSERVTEMRWRLIRRGVLLYVVGLLLDQIWQGTIIVYYGAMFVLAAGVFTWRSRWIVATGIVAALLATTLRTWRFDRNRDGRSTEWLTSPDQESVRRYLFDVFVNGTHPLLPWFAFLCAGIVLGRILTVTWWRPAVTGAGLAL
ncbi:MAG TPA: heparan-alpha-glucosaminide N-acetyltransferase domain-containing protein, partial [Ilumatobacteraceae bacterium]|nr:heparan-alpha-glucosaminide N-acetyltransferase domain-containing protein [Ilumatobacteraceae bacterium]